MNRTAVMTTCCTRLAAVMIGVWAIAGAAGAAMPPSPADVERVLDSIMVEAAGLKYQRLVDQGHAEPLSVIDPERVDVSNVRLRSGQELENGDYDVTVDFNVFDGVRHQPSALRLILRAVGGGWRVVGTASVDL